MKSLSNQQDVKSTQKAMEKAPSWYLGIPDQKTPWYFITLDYADGYVHWYDVGGNGRRIVCAGGLEGKGFATDACPICAHVLELYQEAKRLVEEGDEARAKVLKDRANKLHGKPEVQFKAIRGQRTLLKTKTGKEWVPDFDMEDSESSTGIGVISLSESQFSGLTGMINGETTSFIASGDDLGKRVLWTAKENRKGKSSNYSAVVWSADAAESGMPDVEIPQELLDMDLAENFAIDSEEIEKVYSLISGQAVEAPEADDPVETEAEGDSAETPDDADLDDLPEDTDFVDDLPEEEPASKIAPRVAPRPAATTKAPAAKIAPTSKPAAPAAHRPGATPARPSGKVKL